MSSSVFRRAALAAVLAFSLAAPATAQRAASSCRTAVPATPVSALLDAPSLPSARHALGTRPSSSLEQGRLAAAPQGRARYVRLASQPAPPCATVEAARGDQPLRESELYQEIEGSTWTNRTRTLLSYTDADSLSANDVDVWNGADWQDDWLEEWAYDAQGRVTMHSFTSIFFGQTSGWRDLFTIDEATGLVTESLYQLLNEVTWVDDARTVYVYGDDAYPDTTTTVVWNGAAWTPLFQYVATWDAEGRPLVTENRAYQTNPDGWVALSRSTRTYSPDSILQVGELWIDGAWMNDYRDAYTLDAAGRTTFFLGKFWEEGAWVDVLRQMNAYLHPVGPELTEVEVRWWGSSGEESSGDEWADGWRELYTYDAEERLSTYSYIRGIGATDWENVARYLYTYEGTRPVEVIEQTGDGAGGWVDQRQEILTYDATGVVLEELGSLWTGGTWTPQRRTTFGYQGITAADAEALAAPLELAVYPNPGTEMTISVTLDRAVPVTLEVVDILGRRVARLVGGEALAGTHQLRWRPAGLVSGVYFVRLQAGDQTVVRPVTVVR